MPTTQPTTSQDVESLYFAGADVGASRTKVAVIDADGHMVGYRVHRSGTDFTATADRCLTEALAMADIGKDQLGRTISTGYGRKNVSYAQDQRTEISCHGKGCYHYFSFAITNGAQSVNLIKPNLRLGFSMSNKTFTSASSDVSADTTSDSILAAAASRSAIEISEREQPMSRGSSERADRNVKRRTSVDRTERECTLNELRQL